MSRQAYAWEDNGKFYLSLFQDRGKAKNEYPDKKALTDEAKKRGMTVVWQNG